MHQWNADTQQAMSDLNIPIISAGPQGIDPPENIKFIANPPSDITDIFGNISRLNNERWLDWEGEIIIDEKGKDDQGGLLPQNR